jgi:hypothetical protein
MNGDCDRSAAAPKAKNEVWPPTALADRRSQPPIILQILVCANVLLVVVH